MRAMRAFIFAIAVAVAAYAACGGSSSMLVPAVMGPGGGAVNLSVRLVAGQGDVYLTTYPHTGVSTQTSAEDAASYAFARSGVPADGCDVLFRVDGKGIAGYVEGPSAGTALSVLAYAALNNLSIRNDTLLTGSVDSSGRMGRVGGLYEKANAAGGMGAKYFLVPPVTIYERLLLRGVESRYGLALLEAESADEAIGFMLLNRTINQTGLRAYRKEPPQVPSYDPGAMSDFKGVAEAMVAKEKAAALGLPADDSLTLVLREFFRNESARQEAILAKGYYFTAANEAFLDYIEILTVSDILRNRTDTVARAAEVEACLSSLPQAGKTGANFEWVAGAEMRESWALQRVNDTRSAPPPELMEERYMGMNDLNQAYAWCMVASSLRGQAGTGGGAVDEGAWRDYASRALEGAESANKDAAESSEHLASARLSFSRGAYAAAAYDALYAKDMELADGGLKMPQPGETLAEILQNLSRERRTSLWGGVYHSQATYLLLSNSSGQETIFRLFMYAKDLDSATEDMKAMAGGQQGAAEQPWWLGGDALGAIALVFLITTLLLFYISVYQHETKRQAIARKGK